MIEVHDLSRRFGQHVAVDGISFRLEAGEVVGFLGPNGAGKTTTMRMLTGYLPATRGSIRIGGFDVLRDSLEVRRRIGYLPENVPLFKELRVEEMLDMQARLHQLPKGERAARIDRVLERVGLTDRRRSLIGSLSRGLRQRAGLAVALLPSPAVLILDEPTSGLDPIQRVEVRQLVRELAQEHTVLLSSHLLAEVELICPRVIMLNKGRIVADGQPDQLAQQMGGSYVLFEAVVGDAAQAAKLLKALPGVEAVEDRGRLGIHHVFHVRAPSDLREDVGALAAMKRWAVRELSWHSPSLERLFTRIALGLDEEPNPGDLASLQAAEAHSMPALEGQVQWLGAGAKSAATAANPAIEAKPAVFNLNPFAGSASRDLGAPLFTAGGAGAGVSSSAQGSEPTTPPGGQRTLNPFDGFGKGRTQPVPSPAPVEPSPSVPAPAAPAASSDAKPEPGGGQRNLNPFENFGRSQAADGEAQDR